MPVPTILDQPPTVVGKTPGQPSQKSMTKAERRELQEKQRAAKAASKGQPPQGKPASAPQGKNQQQPQGGKPLQQGGGSAKAKPPPTPMKKTFLAEAAAAKASSKDPNAAGAEDLSSKQSHGLRIFSHFGQPKASSHVLKGDIHPAIIRLGLLFSEFKICGANARCIATLTAFKQVSFSVVVMSSWPHP